MKNFFKNINDCPLFAGIGEEEMQTMLNCLHARQKHYEKNDMIFMMGDSVSAVGIVLSGSIHVIQEDFWGNRAILANMQSGGLFGEAFSCAQTERLPVSVLAVERCDILFIDYRRIFTTCTSACTFHTRLIRNMLRILAGKNIMLTQKMGYLAKRTTREKLLAYLSAEAHKAGSAAFEIPFNRQELAEYLCVDRSAMSGELSKMRRDGILAYRKNKFELLKTGQ